MTKANKNESSEEMLQIEAIQGSEETAEIKQPIDPSSQEVVKLIRKRANWAAALGLTGLPFVNFAGVTAIQIELVKSLCKVYDKTFSETAAKNIISGLLTSGVISLTAADVGVAALAIPVVGLPLAVASRPVINGVCTYAIGHVFAVHFANGGSLIGTASSELSESFKSAVRNARIKMGDIIAGTRPAPQHAVPQQA